MNQTNSGDQIILHQIIYFFVQCHLRIIISDAFKKKTTIIFKRSCEMNRKNRSQTKDPHSQFYRRSTLDYVQLLHLYSFTFRLSCQIAAQKSQHNQVG